MKIETNLTDARSDMSCLQLSNGTNWTISRDMKLMDEDDVNGHNVSITHS